MPNQYPPPTWYVGIQIFFFVFWIVIWAILGIEGFAGGFLAFIATIAGQQQLHWWSKLLARWRNEEPASRRHHLSA